jgi:hypothetical protein
MLQYKMMIPFLFSRQFKLDGLAFVAVDQATAEDSRLPVLRQRDNPDRLGVEIGIP